MDDDLDFYLVGLENNPYFLCWAEDMEHAKEQAEDAYPDDVVFIIYEVGPMVYENSGG